MSANPPRNAAPAAPLILNCNDDEATRYSITHILKRAGFTVEEAGTGEETLERAVSRPDLILQDVRLPGIDGFEVCRRLKANPTTRSIPVVMISASFVTAEDRAQGLEGGADGYLIQPVGPRELIATVHSFLRLRKAEREAKDVRERFEALARATSDAVWDWDLLGNRVWWNESTEVLFGHRPGPEPGADTLWWKQNIHDEDRQRAVAAIHAAIADPQTVNWSAEYRFRRGDGSYAYVLDRGHIIRDETGRAVRMIGTMLDLSDRKAAEVHREQLLASERAARADAEHANRIKDEFLATLSHELRTPLNAILGWSQLLRHGAPDEQAMAEGLEAIERNARAQGQIVEDLLDMSRIISGKLKLDVKPLDLTAVVRAALDSVRFSAEAKGVSLRDELDASAVVHGDPHRLQQIIWNLVSNSIKFTPAGGTVTVSVRVDERCAAIVVRDTGVGIRPDFLPLVFERFRQADATTTRTHRGLGLGLAIVRHLTELHGGHVEAHSEGENRGAEMRVVLPLPGERSPGCAPGASDAPSQAAPVAEPAKRGEWGLPSLKGVKVLIVDDEPDVRELMTRLLSECGATPRTAGSARQALEILQDHRPDVVVSDIGMPHEDGYALIARVRALPAERGGRTPAIALTAFARGEDRERAAAAGFQAHISKPVEPVRLATAIAQLVRREP